VGNLVSKASASRADEVLVLDVRELVAVTLCLLLYETERYQPHSGESDEVMRHWEAEIDRIVV
jgi:hypothetical protein